MNDRPQRTYYRSLVNNIHALPGLGSDFNGVVSLDPSSPEDAEYLGSFTARGLHAPILNVSVPAKIRRRGRYTLLTLEPTILEERALTALRTSLLRARLTTHVALQRFGCHRLPDRWMVTIPLHAPCALTPSRTEGHQHLRIEREISWPTFQAILNALEEALILDYALYTSYCIEEMSYVRLPAPH